MTNVAFPAVLEVDEQGVIRTGVSAGWPREVWYEVKGPARGSPGKPTVPTSVRHRFPGLVKRFEHFTVKPGDTVSFVSWDGTSVWSDSQSARGELGVFEHAAHTALSRHLEPSWFMRSVAPWCDVRDLIWMWREQEQWGYGVEELLEGGLADASEADLRDEQLFEALQGWEEELTTPQVDVPDDVRIAAAAVDRLQEDGLFEIPWLGPVQRITFSQTVLGEPGQRNKNTLCAFPVVISLAGRDALPPSPAYRQSPKRGFFSRLFG